MDRGAWWAAVHGVTKSRTRLSDSTFTFHFYALEKAMATHSSVLAWRIPGTGHLWGRTESDTTEVLSSSSKAKQHSFISMQFCKVKVSRFWLGSLLRVPQGQSQSVSWVQLLSRCSSEDSVHKYTQTMGKTQLLVTKGGGLHLMAGCLALAAVSF